MESDAPMFPQRGGEQHQQGSTSRRQDEPRVLFGINQGARAQGRPANPFDYEQKYDEDEYGEEMSPGARFWRVLLDEGQVFDNEMIDGWRDTLDVLLVFAGLFSAVVTTFVVQSSSALQPDYARISASLMLELIAIQRAWEKGAPVDDVPPSASTLETVSATALDYWCNACWYTSLALSLSIVLVAVLVKQWIQAYKSNTSGTPKQQALVRQFRFVGLKRWHVPLIVALLPMLLHLALLLFFVGLSLYVLTLSKAIAWVVIIIAVLAYILYIVTNLLPMLDCQCPYSTPLSHYVYIAVQALQFAIPIIVSSHTDSSELPSAATSGRPTCTGRLTRLRRWIWTLPRTISVRSRPLPSGRWTLRSRESNAVSGSEDRLTADCLTWIYSTSLVPDVINITLQAICGLPLSAGHLSTSDHRGMVDDIIGRLKAANDDVVDMRSFYRQSERLTRGLLFFDGLADPDVVDQTRMLTAVQNMITSCIVAHNPHLQGSDAARVQLAVLALDGMIRRGGTTSGMRPIEHLAFNQSPLSPLRLHPVVWERITYFPIGQGLKAFPEHSTHLALFLWRAWHARPQTTATVASSAEQYVRSLDWYRLQHVIHGFLRCACTRTLSTVVASRSDFVLHLVNMVVTRRVDQIYFGWFGEPKTLVSFQVEFCNAELRFLAAIMSQLGKASQSSRDSGALEARWGIIESFIKFTRLPCLSLETRRVCASVFMAAELEGRCMSSSVLHTMLQHAVASLPSLPRIESSGASKDLLLLHVDTCFTGMDWAIQQDPHMGLRVIHRLGLLHNIRRHGNALINTRLAARSPGRVPVTGLHSVLAGYIAILNDDIRAQGVDSDDDWAPDRTRGQREAGPAGLKKTQSPYFAYASSPLGGQPSHLAWIVAVSIISEAFCPTVASHALFDSLLVCAHLTSARRPAIWRTTFSSISDLGTTGSSELPVLDQAIHDEGFQRARERLEETVPYDGVDDTKSEDDELYGIENSSYGEGSSNDLPADEHGEHGHDEDDEGRADEEESHAEHTLAFNTGHKGGTVTGVFKGAASDCGNDEEEPHGDAAEGGNILFLQEGIGRVAQETDPSRNGKAKGRLEGAVGDDSVAEADTALHGSGETEDSEKREERGGEEKAHHATEQAGELGHGTDGKASAALGEAEVPKLL